MNKRVIKQVTKTFFDDDYRQLLLKLMLECWNAKTPHFGGGGPHRYDGKSKKCGYCNRPINWKPVNPSFAASEIREFLDDEE